MGKLSQIINNRTVFILSHGASIISLENTIQEYKDIDVCWVSLGLFTNMEKYILSKINRRLDIVFDCASCPDGCIKNYEMNYRFPRLKEFLNRPDNNLWITTTGLKRDSIVPYGPEMLQYGAKTFLVDSIFPANQIGLWMDVPNSLTLLIAAMIAGQAKKIFIFGMDGYANNFETKLIDTYYRPEEQLQDRLAAYGLDKETGISRDTYNFRKRFPILLKNYQRLFRNNCQIYNVSPGSLYQCPEKIKYEQVKGLL